MLVAVVAWDNVVWSCVIIELLCERQASVEMEVLVARLEVCSSSVTILEDILKTVSAS